MAVQSRQLLRQLVGVLELMNLVNLLVVLALRADMVVVVPLQRWVVDGGLPMPETGRILVTGLAALARPGAALLDGLGVIAPGDSDVVAVRRLGLPPRDCFSFVSEGLVALDMLRMLVREALDLFNQS